MKRLLGIAAFTLVSAAISAQSADAIIGKWLTKDGRSHIEIYKPAGKVLYFGKVGWIKDPVDEQGQPQKGLDGKEILNMVLLKNFVFDDGEWVDGTIYDPESGKLYHCTMKLDGINTLKVHGSIDSWGWLGRTETWTRVP